MIGSEWSSSTHRWEYRAGAAERAIRTRYLRRLWGLPGTLLGVSHRPASVRDRLFGPWNYWWQAHVLDCLVDAQIRRPTERRRRDISRLCAGIRVRNGMRWCNDYYDDMAWLALALLRAEQYTGVREPGAVPRLATQLRSGWTEHGGGGIWWRRPDRYQDDFKNVPTNGPAAILFCRLADPPGLRSAAADAHALGTDAQRAHSLAEWIDRQLVDPETGLVYDGLHVEPDGTVREVERTVYTYCQGVFLGGCLELAGAAGGTGPQADLWALRATRTIEAVADHLTLPTQYGATLRGAGGGDGGLFGGILARYLAAAATALPAFGAEHAAAGHLAADLVYTSAHCVWRNRAGPAGAPLFGPDWSESAVPPRRGADPAGDLSVQVGAWMLVEAAATLERAGIGERGADRQPTKYPDATR